MTPAEVLNRAADEIETRGHFKGMLGHDPYAPETCRVCLYGALNAARTGDPFADDTTAVPESALFEVLGLNTTADLVDWNDDPDRTADEVVAVLREAAKLVAA